MGIIEEVPEENIGEQDRVQEIQSLTDPERWAHIAGKENPADLLTRGLLAERLVNTHGGPKEKPQATSRTEDRGDMHAMRRTRSGRAVKAEKCWTYREMSGSQETRSRHLLVLHKRKNFSV